MHNVRFYERLMQRSREAIERDAYADFQREFLAEYGEGDAQPAEPQAQRTSRRKK